MKRHSVLISLSCLAAVLLIASCARRPRPPAGYRGLPATQRPYVIAGKTYYPLGSAQGFRQKGLASWYGPKFHGRRTANGERYDMEAPTAAHKTLPMNTWVQVTNLQNGRQVKVRINDRGPFVDSRIIDLSRSAARRLGVLGPGTARVEVLALGIKRPGSGVAGRPVQYLQPKSYRQGVFTVQVGAFVIRQNALRLAELLRSQVSKVHIQTYDRGDRIFYRVRVGRLPRLEQALALKARMRSWGYHQAFAVAW
jgi:rare lipoprotein A